MMNQKKSDYFVGLDIGTNSIGYATTAVDYNLLRHQQAPIWGVHLFDNAKLANERRTFRAGRRRLDRRQQRIQLLRELFSAEISAVDPDFFKRIDCSSVKKEAGTVPYAIFADSNYTDCDFYKKYPTIHHLIAELIDSDLPHDVRLVYLACAWLLAHRGHFFSDIAKENLDEIISFSSVYDSFVKLVEEHGIFLSWKHKNLDCSFIGDILKTSASKTDKAKRLAEFLQVKKKSADEETLWFDENELLRLLCGLESKSSKLLPGSEYDEVKISLAADDEKFLEILSVLNDDDSALLLVLKKIFDWSVLADILGDSENVSKSKVRIYEKHQSDLKQLKYLAKKYLSHQDYLEIFRSDKTNGYAAYIGGKNAKKIGREDFYKFLTGKLKKIDWSACDTDTTAEDRAIFDQIGLDIAAEKLLPKQVVSDNRTIPYQLYWNELKNLLCRASAYLPFLTEKDADGLSVSDKILSIMEFRIPYFVGPLNSHSSFAWIKRKAEGRILPWNFSQKVDLDASEEAFIRRMTNSCTYLPGEAVLPKHSLLYQKFEVLNLLNALCVNGVPVSVECKQKIYALFFKHSKVSKKTIVSFLKSNNLYQNIDINSITGVDDTITSSLSSWRVFESLMKSQKLTEDEVEQIINQRTFTEDSGRFRDYLKKFSQLGQDDIKFISSKSFQGFGRLSRRFLTTPLFFDAKTGDKLSIINMMWEYNLNLQQLMSERYPFAQMVREERKSYYAEESLSLTERLDKMYVSNSVKRPIIRSLTVLDEVIRTMGYAPKKIFVEMARDVTDGSKGKRTVSRLAQLKNLYLQIADEDARRMSLELEKYDENALQKDTLYLYFMQLGKDMYTGEPITDLSLCDKEHIYPRSKVKDDSLLDNIVLVRSKINGAKSDSYPLESGIRGKMISFWSYLLDHGLITAEKFFRLTRSTPFSADEKWGFINRQLVETRQTTKVFTELLKERYPETEIVYVKAGLVSDFRHKFDMVKSRTVNDLHHGKDAYLNIVVGNVWHECFTRRWFDSNPDQYSIKCESVFGSVKKSFEGEIVWRGTEDIALVKKVLARNYLHLTHYSFCQHGGLFDQNPLKASKDLIPLKKGKSTEIYGGYRKAAAAFFVFALSEELGKKKVKKELTLVPVDLMIADKFLKDEEFAVEYVCKFLDSAGKKKLSIQFPLGRKPVKVKTVFEVDNGLRLLLNGKSSGGSQLLVSLLSPLLLDSEIEKYIKRLESFCEKMKKNPQIIYSPVYDRISSEENITLYDILSEKLRSGIFALRPANPLQSLEDGKAMFESLPPEKQAGLLLGMVVLFGRGSSNGVDLSSIGGVGKAAVTTISSNLSNWKKVFSTVRIIYSDASGLHETKSVNLLDFI